MKRIVLLSLVLSLSPLGIIPAYSAGMDMQGMDMKDAGNTSPGVTKAVGVVKQVDQAKGMVVIAHEPIESLGWSAMTMEFRIEDKSLFGKLKQGKKVDFEFITRGEDYVVTKVK